MKQDGDSIILYLWRCGEEGKKKKKLKKNYDGP